MNPAHLSPSAAVLDHARTLIGFDTTSRNSNLGLIEWTRDLLKRQGVDTRLTYDSQKRKANLFATLGEGRSGGLVLSGHTDVVPVDGQHWRTDPFKAEIADGRLYGRGSADMKGFIACALAAVPDLLRVGYDGPPFHLALSYDEEVGCLGVRGLIADLAEAGITPSACIVGEPTGMELVVGQKGRREMRCCVRGREAHSSLPDEGVNAIEYSSRIISRVQLLAKRESKFGPRDEGFTVPHATLNCGTIKGGIAPNVVPRDCEFSVELRYLPGMDGEGLFDEIARYAQEEVIPEMRGRHTEVGIEWSLVNDTPGFAISETAPLVARLKALVSSRRMVRVAYNTEAGLFQRAGIPTVVCGPGHIEHAHRPNEFIELTQLAACERFLRELSRQSPRE